MSFGPFLIPDGALSRMLAEGELAATDAKPIAGALRGSELCRNLEMDASALLGETDIIVGSLRNAASGQGGTAVGLQVALQRELRLTAGDRAAVSEQMGVRDGCVVAPSITTGTFLGRVANLDDRPCAIEWRCHCSHRAEQQCRK